MGRSTFDGVRDGEWSVFASKVVEERDAALEEVERLRAVLAVVREHDSAALTAERERADRAEAEVERLRANIRADEEEHIAHAVDFHAYVEDVGKTLEQGEDESLFTCARRVMAEVERLRAMIEFAPHHPDCKSHYSYWVDGICAPGEIKRPRSIQCECNCWKAAARGES
jgi:hypothetical protein